MRTAADFFIPAPLPSVRHAACTLLISFAFSGVLMSQELPVDIRSDGAKSFEGGVASAVDNVVIEYGDTTIYADEVIYNPDTQEAFLQGRVRIYREGFNFAGERAVYNFETGRVFASDFSGAANPLFFTAENFTNLSPTEFEGLGTTFSTHDVADPSYHFEAEKVRIYPDDRVIMRNVKFYVGKQQIFWFPYVYQSLREDLGFNITPGYTDKWGAFILTQYGFPLTQDLNGILRLDLRSERGFAGGVDLRYRDSNNPKNYFEFDGYGIADASTDINETGLERAEVDDGRYRVAVRNRTYLTEDLYTTVDINYLSDELVLEDFFESEFRFDPQPDNIAGLTWRRDRFAASLFGRFQVNEFFETVERLPEFALDVTRQPIFGSRFYYEGENSLSNLQRSFAEDSPFPDYDTFRADTFHQFSYQRTLFGWLSINPRAGVRVTHYTDTGFVDEILEEMEVMNPDGSTETVESIRRELVTGGSDTRTVFNIGMEASFKLSREYPNVQSRFWGLESMRHIIQPYTNFSYVSDPSVDPDDILQFDEFLPSTELQRLNFPQFTSIDSIDEWTIWRFGVRNRWQTKRDGGTFNWLTLDTFFDANIDNPFDDTDLSNLFNELQFQPVPWFRLDFDSQLPVFDDGFSEVNTDLNFLPTDFLRLRIGHRFLDDNDFFQDSNLMTFGAYWQISDNWGFSIEEQYEFDDSTLETQAYTLHRDLSAWVASLSAIVRDNRDGNDSELGVFLTFTLKDFPRLNLGLPVSGIAGSTGGTE